MWVTEGCRTFGVTTCQLWNSLNQKLRNTVSLKSLKNYRKSLFKEQQELHQLIAWSYLYIFTVSSILYALNSSSLYNFYISFPYLFCIDNLKFWNLILVIILERGPQVRNEIHFQHWRRGSISFVIKKKIVVSNGLPLIWTKTAMAMNPNIRIACLAITFPVFCLKACNRKYNSL